MGALILADVKKYLPEIVQDIAEIIGLENLENFLKQFGGVVFNFTKGKGYFPILEQTLGTELANKLQAFFSGEKNVYIPRCNVALRVLRNARIKADFDYYTQEQGLSARKTMLQLAPKYQLSDRALWQIIKDTR
ncbi:mor transcription activator family protein [Haemophilus quentini]|uniref:Mor transcription activator family protein n=1 Tax=Haemophilus quentini TaxID=123834 RepID=A0ABX3BRG4_9PAST|nr:MULTISPECIES: Mor transcription activator family protein [Haemophilus]EGT81166.1 putative homeodomain-like protein [Haemophilus haemolyticus M21639]NYA48516.1 mor transcription activator family protein [Haemophilus haemolyticus]OEY76860.1 mor transcription activator family protein [Haemophilus quentini]OEY77730.1 mor transcription activator family protein [Haemophilus quentini]ORC34786.1 mor transcription activator family protein [Haemophilus quentini]